MFPYNLIITKMAARMISTRRMLPITMRFDEDLAGTGAGVVLGSGFGCGFGCGWGFGWGCA